MLTRHIGLGRDGKSWPEKEAWIDFDLVPCILCYITLTNTIYHYKV